MLVRIAVAVVLVPLLLLAMLPSSPLIWSIVVAAIAAAASFELLRAAGEDKVSPWMTCVAVLSAALIPLGCWMGKGTTTVSVCTFVVMAVSFWCAIRAYDEGTAPIGFYHVMLTLFSGVLIPLGLSALVLLKMMDHGEYWVLFAVLMAFVTDAGAYFVGVFFGKHRGITKVSPNKSLEGYIGGFVFGVLYALAYGGVIQAISHNPVNFLPLAKVRGGQVSRSSGVAGPGVRSGQVKAYWMGTRMSAVPSWARIAPSLNSTREWMMLSRCTTT